MSSCGPAANGVDAAGKVAVAKVFRLIRFGRSSRAMGVGVGGRRAGTVIGSAIIRKFPVDNPRGAGGAEEEANAGEGETMSAGEAMDEGGGTIGDAGVRGEAGTEGDPPDTRGFPDDPLKKPNPLPPFRGVVSMWL